MAWQTSPQKQDAHNDTVTVEMGVFDVVCAKEMGVFDVVCAKELP
jgi:hypothetical protein